MYVGCSLILDFKGGGTSRTTIYTLDYNEWLLNEPKANVLVVIFRILCLWMFFE